MFFFIEIGDRVVVVWEMVFCIVKWLVDCGLIECYDDWIELIDLE